MSTRMRYQHRILDTVWYLEGDVSGDQITIVIHDHSRPDLSNQGTFKIIEGDGRVAEKIEVQDSSSKMTYTVTNPENVFSYGKYRPIYGGE